MTSSNTSPQVVASNSHKAAAQLGNAQIVFHDGQLQLDTGLVRAAWGWTGYGFATTAFCDRNIGQTWCDGPPAHACDWVLPGCVGQTPEAELVAVEAAEQDDEGFTTPHVCFSAEMIYPKVRLRLRFVVWAYPDSPGFRTQLWIRGMEGYCYEERSRYSSRQVCLPIPIKDQRRRLIGYYNDPQHRNDTHLNLLAEYEVDGLVKGPEWYRWNSILCLETSQAGLALVKESHRCANQPGIDGGAFKVDPQTGLESDGWGIFAQEISTDRFLPAWAHWHIAYANDRYHRELAIKQFDRLRYPLHLDRDVRMIANTWGTRKPGPATKAAAAETEVLREIESQAELGIDVQQIDDGWQGDDYERFVPSAERYPQGWAKVRQAAQQSGVELGLWYPAPWVSPEELLANFKEGGFRQYKLDFVNVKTGEELYDLLQKFRTFVKQTGYSVNCDWDVTENLLRVGYFYGRDIGRLYLENRKPRDIPWAIYRPHTTLRDFWQAARYLNLNQIQATIQNPAMVDPRESDAPQHDALYCVAMALMGIPVFFQETHHYQPPVREQIRELLQVYRAHRQRIFEGYVFPIGDRPDNRQWTGFQCHHPQDDNGYLTVFRELHNEQSKHTLALYGMTGGELELEDLRTGQTHLASVGGQGEVDFSIEQAPGFRFYRYQHRPSA